METRINIESPPQPSQLKSNRVKVLYVDITDLSSHTQFCICAAAVFLLFIVYGYLQELIFTLDGFKPYGWYLTLVQFGFYSIFGWAETLCSGNTTRRMPIVKYCVLAALTLGTMGFSNSSLSHLNYPTQVIFKCCKLLPVMAGSVIIQGKKYSGGEVVAAVLMCAGLSVFTLADSQLSPNFSLIGVVMISVALGCDAVIGNLQEKYMRLHQASNREVVLYSYFFGFIYLLVITSFTGHFSNGFSYFLRVPEAYWYAGVFSVSGYLGVQVVLTLVTSCGALTAVTVTTCRKAVSILISFLIFYKPFSFQYVWGGGLIVMGIYLNVWSKKSKPTRKYKSLETTV